MEDVLESVGAMSGKAQEERSLEGGEASSARHNHRGLAPTPSVSELASKSTICEEKLGDVERAPSVLAGVEEDTIPTGPLNGFLWDERVDGPLIGWDGSRFGDGCGELREEDERGEEAMPVFRPFVIGSVVGTFGAAIYQVRLFLGDFDISICSWFLC